MDISGAIVASDTCVASISLRWLPWSARFLHQSRRLPSCDGDSALGCYRVPSDAAKHDLAVAAADADATAACDGADLLLQVAGVDRDLDVEHADQLHALIKH